MVTEHAYQALHHGDAITAACSCGWVSAYAHASDGWAYPDWLFHFDGRYKLTTQDGTK